MAISTKTSCLYGRLTNLLHPPFFPLSLLSLSHCPSTVNPPILPPFVFPISPLHCMACTLPPPPNALPLLHKLPVIDPGHITIVCPPLYVCEGLSNQSQVLMRLPQRPIDERPNVRHDDPSQVHPELFISCPRLPLHTKMPTVDRDLKRQREREGQDRKGKNDGNKKFAIERYFKKKEKRRHMTSSTRCLSDCSCAFTASYLLHSSSCLHPSRNGEAHTPAAREVSSSQSWIITLI